MRLVQVTIPTGKRQAVLKTLDDEGIDYVVTDETSGTDYSAVVYVPLPTNAVEPVMEMLREAGIERDAYTVVVDAETVVSKRFERLRERYEEGEDAQVRIAREELRTKAMELAPKFRTFAFLTVVSVVIATAGLLLDSPSVVVGSMVIAPLIGPAMAANVGTVLGDRHLFRRGVRLQVAGIVLAVATATVFALLVKQVHLVPPGLNITDVGEIAGRVRPDFLSLAVALGAGVAGALSLRSGVSASLVGVMIAVALVPPTAVIGIGIAWGRPYVVAGSTVLVLVNALSINLAALVTFWYEGYRPTRWFAWEEAESSILRQGAVLVVAILVLSTFLGGVTYASYRQAVTKEGIDRDVRAVVTSADATVLGVNVVYEDSAYRNPLSPSPERVVVTVGVPPGTSPPDLASRLSRRLASYGNPSVQVRFVQVQSA